MKNGIKPRVKISIFAYVSPSTHRSVLKWNDANVPRKRSTEARTNHANAGVSDASCCSWQLRTAERVAFSAEVWLPRFPIVVRARSMPPRAVEDVPARLNVRSDAVAMDI